MELTSAPGGQLGRPFQMQKLTVLVLTHGVAAGQLFSKPRMMETVLRRWQGCVDDQVFPSGP